MTLAQEIAIFVKIFNFLKFSGNFYLWLLQICLLFNVIFGAHQISTSYANSYLGCSMRYLLFLLNSFEISINWKYLTSIAWYEFTHEVESCWAPKITLNDQHICKSHKSKFPENFKKLNIYTKMAISWAKVKSARAP